MFSLTALAIAIALVQAARAVVEWHPEQFGEIGLVLPGGHSALVVVAVTTVTALVWARWSRRRVAAAAALILAVAGVMTTLGGHTVGDVLVGLALGGIAILVAGGAARFRRSRRVVPA